MPKKIKFESFIYRFLIEANELKNKCPKEDLKKYEEFIENISFEHLNNKAVIKSFRNKIETKSEVSLNEQFFYIRGDSIESLNKQKDKFYHIAKDPVMDTNKNYFTELVQKIFKQFLLSSSNSNIPS